MAKYKGKNANQGLIAELLAAHWMVSVFVGGLLYLAIKTMLPPMFSLFAELVAGGFLVIAVASYFRNKKMSNNIQAVPRPYKQPVAKASPNTSSNKNLSKLTGKSKSSQSPPADWSIDLLRAI